MRARILDVHRDEIEDAAKTVLDGLATGLAIGMLNGLADRPDIAQAVEYLIAQALRRQLADRYGAA
jgi:hypothetical protein